MAIGKTPILGLPYGVFDWHNRAVEKLDQALLYGPDGNVLVRNDVHIQGDLTVDGTTNIGGPASQLDANGTILDVDAIADGQFLRRTGTTVVSGTPADVPASQLDANGTTLDVNVITDGELLKRVGSTVVSTPVVAVPTNLSISQMRPVTSGLDVWWPPNFATQLSLTSLDVADNNICRMALFWTGRTITFDGIGFLRGGAWLASKNYRFGFYTLNQDTLHPTALGATANWVPASGANFTSTTFAALSLANVTLSPGFFGLAVRLELIVGVGSSINRHAVTAIGLPIFAPYGHHMSTSAQQYRGQGVLLSSDVVAGAMPAAASFAVPNDATNGDWGAVLHVASIS